MNFNELCCPAFCTKLGCLVYLLSRGFFPSSYALSITDDSPSERPRVVADFLFLFLNIISVPFPSPR